eukprot:3582844-Prymnesium_polylepis.1
MEAPTPPPSEPPLPAPTEDSRALRVRERRLRKRVPVGHRGTSVLLVIRLPLLLRATMSLHQTVSMRAVRLRAGAPGPDARRWSFIPFTVVRYSAQVGSGVT